MPCFISFSGLLQTLPQAFGYFPSSSFSRTGEVDVGGVSGESSGERFEGGDMPGSPCLSQLVAARPITPLVKFVQLRLALLLSKSEHGPALSNTER